MGHLTQLWYAWVCGPSLLSIGFFYVDYQLALLPITIPKYACKTNAFARTFGRGCFTVLLCCLLWTLIVPLTIIYAIIFGIIDLIRLFFWAITLGCCFQCCHCRPRIRAQEISANKHAKHAKTEWEDVECPPSACCSQMSRLANTYDPPDGDYSDYC